MSAIYRGGEGRTYTRDQLLHAHEWLRSAADAVLVGLWRQLHDAEQWHIIRAEEFIQQAADELGLTIAWPMPVDEAGAEKVAAE